MSERIPLNSTARLHLQDAFGQRQTIRALMSTTSISSLITSECANALGLMKYRFIPKRIALNDQFVWTFDKVFVRFEAFNLPIECLVVPDLNIRTPAVECDFRNLTSVTPPIRLADVEFNIPSNIDMVLSSDVTMRCINGSSLEFDNGLVLCDSVFGKVVSGSVPRFYEH
mgnify:FL=1